MRFVLLVVVLVFGCSPPATDIVISSVAPELECVLRADGNGDGAVDGADYTLWADNWGRTDANGAAEGDFCGNGTVDGADYTIWADEWGHTCD